MKKWHKRIHCPVCKKGYKTYGGIKLFGIFKIKKWEHLCGVCDKIANEGMPKGTEVIVSPETQSATITVTEKHKNNH